MSFQPFWALKVVIVVYEGVRKLSRSKKKLCSEDEHKSYGFGTT